MGVRFIILSTCQVCVKFLRWCVMLTIQKVNSLPSCCFNLRLIKQTSDKNGERYQFGDYKSIHNQILKTNIARNVWQTVRRIFNEILRVKGLKERIERSVMFYLSVIAKNKQKFSTVINSRQTRRLRILEKKRSYKIVRGCVTSISQDQQCTR